MKNFLVLVPLFVLGVAGCSGDKTAASDSTVATHSETTSTTSATNSSKTPASPPVSAAVPPASASTGGKTASPTTNPPTGAVGAPAQPPKPMPKTAAGPGLVGSWKATLSGLPSTITPQQLDMIKKQAAATSLELGADHKFSFGTSGNSVAGNWEEGATKLSLHVATINGQSLDTFKKGMVARGMDPAKIDAEMNKPIEFTIGAGKKKLVLVPGAGQQGKGTLTLNKT